LAKDLGVTCYDAAYLSLAEELGFEFITADEAFCRKVSETGRLRAPVRLLADVEDSR